MTETDEEGLIDEQEEGSIGNKHILINRLACLLSLLLTEHFQPHKRGHTLHYKIREQRVRARLYLEDNPSLKTKKEEILGKAYAIAVPKVLHETGLMRACSVYFHLLPSLLLGLDFPLFFPCFFLLRTAQENS